MVEEAGGVRTGVLLSCVTSLDYTNTTTTTTSTTDNGRRTTDDYDVGVDDPTTRRLEDGEAVEEDG
eukprot:7664537-Pyramimonas_sp.AAC.1